MNQCTHDSASWHDISRIDIDLLTIQTAADSQWTNVYVQTAIFSVACGKGIAQNGIN